MIFIFAGFWPAKMNSLCETLRTLRWKLFFVTIQQILLVCNSFAALMPPQGAVLRPVLRSTDRFGRAKEEAKPGVTTCITNAAHALHLYFTSCSMSTRRARRPARWSQKGQLRPVLRITLRSRDEGGLGAVKIVFPAMSEGKYSHPRLPNLCLLLKSW